MLPRPRTVALATLSLALVPALVVGPAPVALAAGKADTDGVLAQVHTSGFQHLPDGLYRLVGTGYASQFGVDADGNVVSAVGDDGYFGAPAPATLDGEHLVQLDAGYRHGLALDDFGHATTWGYVGDPPDTSTPATIPDDVAATRLVQVAAGGDHDLAITGSGTVVGWGTNEGGTLDVPSGLSGVAQVDTGDYASAARLSDGTVRSWGSYAGSTPSEYADQAFTDVAAADTGVLALTSDGKVAAWGGYGVDDVPTEVADGTVVAIGGGTRAVAVLSDGRVFQWGGCCGQDIGAPAVPAGTSTLDVQWGRYASAVVSSPTTPTRAPRIEQAPAPHAGLAALTADPGRWTTMTDPEFHYAWSLDGEPVGDDSPTLTLPWDDLGSKVTLEVTASDGALFGQAPAKPLKLTVGRARFDVTGPDSVRRGAKVQARSTGLAPNEPFILVLGGQSLADGTADRKGDVSVRATVSRRVPLGSQSLVVVGATEERYGTTKVEVRR